MGSHGLDLSGSGYGQVAGACECNKNSSGSINCRALFDYLRNC